jgi:hypothetical protein
MHLKLKSSQKSKDNHDGRAQCVMRANHYIQQQRYSGKSQYGESGKTLAHRSQYVKMLKSRQRRIGERGEEGGRKKKVLIIPESSQRLRERDDAGGRGGRGGTRERK